MLRTLGALALFTPLASAQVLPPPPVQPYAWYQAGPGINGQMTPGDGVPVTSWVDSTSLGRDLMQVDPAVNRQPIFRAATTSTPAHVAFDGDDYIWGNGQSEFGTLSGAQSFVAVARIEQADRGYLFDSTSVSGRNAAFTGQNSSPSLWTQYSGTGAGTPGPYVEVATFQVHTFLFGSTGHRHFINGSLVSSGTEPASNMVGLMLGARYSINLGLTGDVAQFLAFDHELSSAEQSATETWLYQDYPITAAPPSPTFTDVFVAGDGVYPSYRIPSVLTTSAGTVLAFAEGRQSLGDHAQNDIVMRRSTDGGASFAPVVVLHDDAANSLNNPCVLQVDEGLHAGRIIVFYQRFPQGCHESCVVPGYVGTNICRSFKKFSDDDGLTWSPPIENTMEVKRPTIATSVASGPGVGIQKRRAPFAGRLIMPFNQGPSGSWKVYAAYSDNGGDSWAYGQTADDSGVAGVANEVQMVELVDGSLLLNARHAGATSNRLVSRSTDGGVSWTPLISESELIEPGVMASTLRFTDPLDGYAIPRLLYAGPHDTGARQNGAVHVSSNEGQSWPRRRTLWGGAYAYSVLTVLHNGQIGVLFERDNYAALSLARLDYSWVTGFDDCAGNIRELCPTSPNSVGGGAQLSWSGGCSIGLNQGSLHLTDGPALEPVLFVYAAGTNSLPFGDGTLCLGGTLRSLNPVQALSSGSATRALDFSLPPFSIPGSGTPLPGGTLHFQAYYRDPSGPGGSGSNLSNGLSITFCP